jgi:hypothetical protein
LEKRDIDVPGHRSGHALERIDSQSMHV